MDTEGEVQEPQGPYSELPALIKELCQDNSESKTNWIDCVDKAFSLSETLSHQLDLYQGDKSEFDFLCVTMWNKSVNLKAKGNIDSIVLAKLRQMSFYIICCKEESLCDEISLKRQLMMGLKTAKAWLETGEFSRAEVVLSSVNRIIQRVEHLFMEKKKSTNLDVTETDDKFEMDHFSFQILCTEAELLFAQGKTDESLTKITNAKAMLTLFTDKSPYLSNLCYNFGVDCYNANYLERGIKWLRESYTIGAEGPHVNQSMQAKTLRLMAKGYLKWEGEDWKEKAFNALTLANNVNCFLLELHPHVCGVYLKCCLLLAAKEDTAVIQTALGNLVQHPEFDTNLCLNVLQMIKKYKQPQIAFESRHVILHAHKMSPEYGQLLVTFLDLFLNDDELERAQTFSEECINAHASGQRLDDAAKKNFHVLFWNKAAGFFKSQNYEQALKWYNYSLSLYSSLSPTEVNLDKLQRNIATCYLLLGKTDKALTAIEMSERCNPDCAYTYFIAFKIAFEMGNIDKVASYLQKTVHCVSTSREREDEKIICLAAYTALQSKTPNLAIPALECFISKSPQEKRTITALKCLLRLLASNLQEKRMDVKVILVHLRNAHRKLVELRDHGYLSTAEINEDAAWFMKMSWNLGLHCQGEDFAMKEFFSLCVEFLSLCPVDLNAHERHQNCQLLSCAACLKLARKATSKDELEMHLHEALQHIEEYRQADRQTKVSLYAEGTIKPSVSADKLMLIYEFEALSKLNSPQAERILDRALTLPNADGKLFKTLSALGIDPPSSNVELSIRALKCAIQIHLQEDNTDFTHCSEDIRNLLDMYLKHNEDTDALIYLKEILDVIEMKAKDSYPVVELLWLMTRSWNNGLLHFKYQEAEHWCSQSMRLLKFLPSTKGDYEQQMMSFYSELLGHLEKSKEGFMEE